MPPPPKPQNTTNSKGSAASPAIKQNTNACQPAHLRAPPPRNNARTCASFTMPELEMVSAHSSSISFILRTTPSARSLRSILR